MMRVWVYGDTWREFGERRFEISWWVMKKSVLDNPDFQSGNWDFDPDRDSYEKVEVCKSKDLADRRAQEIVNTHDDLC
jgi:hypothetical protein